jgi:plasmid maintenance system killer protein
MELRYADNEIERRCTDERHMQRKLGAPISKALRLRLNELRRVDDMGDLLLFAGRWEELAGDRAGQWSGRLTANWRLIVRPDNGTILVTVVEIVDYHKR